MLYSPVQFVELGSFSMRFLAEDFDHPAEMEAPRVALVEENSQWTFAELADESDRIAAALKERIKGDTVGILLLNSQKYIVALLAVWKAGKIAVPLNYLLP